MKTLVIDTQAESFYWKDRWVRNVNMWVGSHWLVSAKQTNTYTYRFSLRATPFQESKAQVTDGCQNFSTVFFLLDFLGAEGHFFLAPVLQACCCCHFARSCSAVCAQPATSTSSTGFGVALPRRFLQPNLWTRTHVRTFLTSSPRALPCLSTFSWTINMGNTKCSKKNNRTKLSQDTGGKNLGAWLLIMVDCWPTSKSLSH